MAHSGFVRIYRRLIEDHPAFRNDAEAMAFAWMIMKASWQPTSVRYKGKRFNLARGEVVVSQRDMARAMDRDKAWVERLWKRLSREAMIETRREAGLSVIIICNYDTFQGARSGSEAVDEAHYALNMRQAQGTEQIREEDQRNETHCAGEPAPVLRPFGENEAPPDVEPSEHYSSAFEAWWREYPNKTGKRKAAQCYDAAFKRLGGARIGAVMVHQKLMDALVAQRRIWKRRAVEGRYIPHASTWLSQSRYEDDPVVKEMQGPTQRPVAEFEEVLTPLPPKPIRPDCPECGVGYGKMHVLGCPREPKPRGWVLGEEQEA